MNNENYQLYINEIKNQLVTKLNKKIYNNLTQLIKTDIYVELKNIMFSSVEKINFSDKEKNILLENLNYIFEKYPHAKAWSTLDIFRIFNKFNLNLNKEGSCGIDKFTYFSSEQLKKIMNLKRNSENSLIFYYDDYLSFKIEQQFLNFKENLEILTDIRNKIKCEENYIRGYLKDSLIEKIKKYRLIKLKLPPLIKDYLFTSKDGWFYDLISEYDLEISYDELTETNILKRKSKTKKFFTKVLKTIKVIFNKK